MPDHAMWSLDSLDAPESTVGAVGITRGTDRIISRSGWRPGRTL